MLEEEEREEGGEEDEKNEEPGSGAGEVDGPADADVFFDEYVMVVFVEVEQPTFPILVLIRLAKWCAFFFKLCVQCVHAAHVVGETSENGYHVQKTEASECFIVSQYVPKRYDVQTSDEEDGYDVDEAEK